MPTFPSFLCHDTFVFFDVFSSDLQKPFFFSSTHYSGLDRLEIMSCRSEVKACIERQLNAPVLIYCSRTHRTACTRITLANKETASFIRPYERLSNQSTPNN